LFYFLREGGSLGVEKEQGEVERAGDDCPPDPEALGTESTTQVRGFHGWN